MNPYPHFVASPGPAFASRRQFLQRTGSGFGLLALASILDQGGLLRAAENVSSRIAFNPLEPRPGHFPVKVKSVIWLFMNGGQSQVDTWDYKPALTKRDGQTLEGFD